MQVMSERCCGLDVHQETVVACLLIGSAGSRPSKEVRTFRTMTRELEALRDWLKAAGTTHVGMESTGVYWRPVYAVLEGDFELIVGNARHVRNVPGRKTDVKDAEWIAELVRHGLIAKSFVPPPPLRELRELLRYRRKLVESQSAERNRLLKLLETANVKLASVASDVFGVSGRAMLKALVEGGASPEAMAALAKGRLRRKSDDLVLALEGRVEEHHRFLLAMQLHRLDAAEQDIEALDQRIDERLEPYRLQHALLMQMKGTQTVITGHSSVRWFRGAVQGYSEPDFDPPSGDADLVNDEAEELLPLVEVQSVDGGPDLVGEAFDSISQLVLLSQLLALVEQRSPLPLKRATTQFQFLATAFELFPLDETGLIEIDQSPAFSRHGVDLVIEPRKLRGKQLVISCLPSRGNRRLSAQQHVRTQHGSADLIEDEGIEFISSNVAFRTPPMLAAGPKRIVVEAIVVVVEGPVAARHLMARHGHATVAAFDEPTQEPPVRLRATWAPL